MPIPLRWRIFIFIGLGHLLLVTLGTVYFEFAQIPGIGGALARYGEASGSDSNYGFFTPGIEGQLRVWFDRVDSLGQHATVKLERGFNREADLRFNNIIDQYSAEHDDPTAFERAMSASLAAAMINRYPGTRQVSVHIDEFRPVSMESFRKGERPQWNSLYVATFDAPDGAP